MIGLILALALTQQPQQKIALILDGQTVIMSVTEAQKRARETNDPKFQAALDIALGTLPSEDVIECVDRQARCHTIRGRRLPAQGIN